MAALPAPERAQPKDDPLLTALRRDTANPQLLGAYLVLLAAFAVCAQVGCFILPDGYTSRVVLGATIGSLAIYVFYYLSLTARRERACLLSPDLLFGFWLLMFHVPALLLITLGVADVKRNFWYNTAKVDPSILLVLTGLLGFLLGYNLLAKRPAFYTSRPKPATDNSELWLYAGTMVLIAGMVSVLFFVSQIGFSTLLKGEYTYTRFQGRFYDERAWFFGMFLSRVGIAIISVYSAALHRTLVKGSLNRVLVGAYAFFIYITGNRDAALDVVVIMLFAYSFMVRPLKTRWILVVAFGGVFLLTAGKVIRHVGDKSVGRVRQALSDNQESIGFVPLLMEAGGSVRTIFRTMSIVPAREGFRYGSTFTDSAMSAVPNLTASEGALRKKEALSSWMMRITQPKQKRQGSGFGFSIIGEGYVNFGLVGPLIMLFTLGALTRRVFDRAFYQQNAFRMVIAVLWLVCLLGWVRNDSVRFIKGMIWAASVVFIIRLVISNTRDKSTGVAQTTHPAAEQLAPPPAVKSL